MHYIKNVGYVEVSGRKVCSKREMDLRLARTYGHEGDRAKFTRLVIESRVAVGLLNEAFRTGARAHAGI